MPRDGHRASGRSLPAFSFRPDVGDHGLVVGYDDSGLVPSAKLFWVLEYLGRGNVAVLNGGFPAWQLAGLPVEAGGPATPATPAQLSFSVAEYRRAHRSDVLAAPNEPDTVLVDARTADEYARRSQTAERDGHIPGAVHLNWERHIVALMSPTLGRRTPISCCGCWGTNGSATTSRRGWNGGTNRNVRWSWTTRHAEEKNKE